MSRIVKKLEEEKTRNMRTTMEAVEKLDRFLLHTPMRFTHGGQRTHIIFTLCVKK